MDETERFLIPLEVQPRIPFLTSHVFAFTGSPNAFARIAPLREWAATQHAEQQSARVPIRPPKLLSRSKNATRYSHFTCRQH